MKTQNEIQRKIVQLETPKTILGTTGRSSHALESDPSTSRITPLWGAFMQKGMTASIPEAKSREVYAVYNEFESDLSGMYTVTVGAESDAEASGDLKQSTIPTGKYLVFEGKGALPQCTMDAYQEVWAYFASEEAEHERAYTTDFEHYSGLEGVEVYIAIK